MKRRYGVICSFFVGFLALSLMCYASYRYAERNGEQETIRRFGRVHRPELKKNRQFPAIRNMSWRSIVGKQRRRRGKRQQCLPNISA